ncbi:ParB/RepB/Spo0J family partition protein [Bacillus sp. FJAT-42376]|uniref:ParB/RepB/Spo0J family partition protein n=1 Tax=Bacillus sp. FJAT-42376 TaxID=2014076 RepID=UPI000F51035C|nr:ParB/RepB/Spo0J family partition protein [Bacillus sp. FJAT-42376]AZB41129.1 ParB/RepB/Spo0J family partition protein [Bacillus sp. FJAT-42376]
MPKGLGKGLESLLQASKEETVQELKCQELRPNPYQPRKTFQEEAIEELKESILHYGILQPIIVRKSIKGYEIVAGERRFRAAKLAGLKTVPAVVRELNDRQMMELGLLENLQREDLTPLEEAKAYQSLLEELNMTQEELAQRLGKSRPHIANHLRLLSLPAGVQALINEGKLSMGHGRTILGLKKKDKLLVLAEKIVKEQLNVRQTEILVQQLNESGGKSPDPKKQIKRDLFLAERETSLQQYFGTKVSIKQQHNKGRIEIEFTDSKDLERILELLATEESS